MYLDTHTRIELVPNESFCNVCHRHFILSHVAAQTVGKFTAVIKNIVPPETEKVSIGRVGPCQPVLGCLTHQTACPKLSMNASHSCLHFNPRLGWGWNQPTTGVIGSQGAPPTPPSPSPPMTSHNKTADADVTDDKAAAGTAAGKKARHSIHDMCFGEFIFYFNFTPHSIDVLWCKRPIDALYN